MKVQYMRITGSLVIVALLAAGTWLFHRQLTPNSFQPVNRETRSIVDMAGRNVTLPLTINRVSSNGISLSSLLLALGAAPQLTAISSHLQANDWFVRVYPGIRQVPVAFSPELKVEELLAAKPDAVILWSNNEPVQQKIEAVGIPVVVVHFSTPEEFMTAVRILGNVLNRQEQAERFCRYYKENEQKVLAKLAWHPEMSKPKVYYAADGPLNTEGRQSFVTSWIEAAGGINAAAAGGIDKVRVDISMETVLGWNPDIIIVRDAPTKTAILQDERWSEVTAVKTGKIYVSPKGVNVWSTRSGESSLQLLWSAGILHPELFTDVELTGEVRRFYKEFYGYTVTDQEIAEILIPVK